MKYKKLLILLTIATLSLTACGKDSEPSEVPTETAVEEISPEEPESEDMDCVTNADRGTAVGEVVENNTEINEDGTRPINEDMTYLDHMKVGLDIMLENGEITQEEYDKMLKDLENEEYQEESSSEQSDMLSDLEKLYKMGEMSEEEYNELKKEYTTGESTPKDNPDLSGLVDEILSESGVYAEPEDTPLPPGATYADPSQDTEIDWDKAAEDAKDEIPDHLKNVM